MEGKKKEKKKIEEKKKEEDGLFVEGPAQPEEENGLSSVARDGLRRVSKKNHELSERDGESEFQMIQIRTYLFHPQKIEWTQQR